MEGFYRQEGGAKKLLGKEKIKYYFRLGYLPLGGRAEGLMQVTSGVIRKFQTVWFKIPLLGEAETAISLGLKPQFGDLVYK